MQETTKNEDKEVEGITEELDFTKPSYTFIPGVHSYRQEGYFLVCRVCELTHAVFIGKDKVLVGEENGQPIIKKRKEVGMV